MVLRVDDIGLTPRLKHMIWIFNREEGYSCHFGTPLSITIDTYIERASETGDIDEITRYHTNIIQYTRRQIDNKHIVI